MRFGPRAALVLCGMATACGSSGVVYIGEQVDPVDQATDAGACHAVTLPSVDYCALVPALPAAPTIDGILDCGLPLASLDASGWKGAVPFPSDLAVEYASAFRADGLYVFVHVKKSSLLPAAASDTRVYCGDAVHVFADSDGVFNTEGAYDVPGTRQLVAGAPANATTSATRGTLYTPTASTPWSSGFATFPTPDGYVLEAFVTAADLGLDQWSLVGGNRIGFDLSISYGGTPSEYGDSTCPKSGDFVLRRAIEDAADSDGMPQDDTRAFCLPTTGP